VGRASLRDKGSVALSRDLVEALLGELMKFDFRNGMALPQGQTLSHSQWPEGTRR
jgi:hypothetical protein